MPTAWRSRQSPSVPVAPSYIDVISYQFSVIKGLIFCSGCLPEFVPTTGANQAEEPQRIMGKLGMDFRARITDPEVPVPPVVL